MLKFLGWIFGREGTQECQSDPNHESLATRSVNRNNATTNQNHPYSDFHQLDTSYHLSRGTRFLSRDPKFNCSGSNVSVLNKQEESVIVSSSSVIKSKNIIVDSENKTNTRLGTFEKKINDFEMKPSPGLRKFENRKMDQELDSKTELHLSHNSSSVSSKLPVHSSIPPPIIKPCSISPSSLFETTPAASPYHHSVTNESTSVLASSNLTTLETNIKHIQVEKGDSHLHEVTDDIQQLIKGDKLDSSACSSLLGKSLASPKCPPNSSKATITSDSSNKQTLNTEVLNISIKKGKSLSYNVADDCKDGNTRGIVPLVLEKHSSPPTPEWDSSSPFPSLGRHPTSPKWPSFSKKPTVSVPSASATQQNKNKSIWVQKGASCCAVSEDFTNLTSEASHKSDLLLSSFGNSHVHEAGKQNFNEGDKSDSSVSSYLLGKTLASPKCHPNFNKATITSDSSKKKTLQAEFLNITVKKDDSLYDDADDFKDANTRSIAPLVLKKRSSSSTPTLDSSSPLPSLGRHLTSPKCSSFSKKPTVSVSFNSATQHTKDKSMWVQKGASSHSVVSEDITNLTSIDIGQGDLEKPIFEAFHKSYLSSTTQQNKTKYVWVEKGALPLYIVPEDFKILIKRDIVPEVLKKPLSPLTYKDYFAALLYAEDCYIEKWDGFEMEDVSMEVKMKNVSLKLHRAEIHRRNGKSKKLYRSADEDNRTFVQFEMDSIPEKRPFLLSKDFAYVRPSGTEDTPFKGIIYRIEKSKHLLVEFGKEFYEQHYSECKYDVKFSLNRVCLKRAHKAVEAASDVVFSNFLFPKSISISNNVSLEELHPFQLTLKQEQGCAVHRIVMHQSPYPYLVEGPLSVSRVRRNRLISEEILTTTGKVIQDAVLQLLRTSLLNRILICAPSNSACDALMRNLQKEIPISDMFRSNAAFREFDEVPDDILPHCPYEEEQELFPCPPLAELKKFRLILSTFMSTFRLHHEGLKAGHFSHIFLVDASSAIEPETLVPLSNLANEKTVVVVTGKPGGSSRWVRSKIARENGLKTSYFERLQNSVLYMTLNPQVISQLSMIDFDST